MLAALCAALVACAMSLVGASLVVADQPADPGSNGNHIGQNGTAPAATDTGKSPNGAPGPAGNPNQPAAQPQANGPQGPAGNDARGKSQASHGKSQQSHGKSGQAHGKSQQSHGNSAEGKQNNFGHGKITICHATKSEKNPYVEITISVNGLHGHGPTDSDAVSRHHAGSWHDIIPAPSGGCPSTVQPSTTTTATPAAAPAAAQPSAAVAAQPEVAKSMVLGAHASGGGDTPETEVLGENASGGSAPAAAQAARAADTRGSLPFTGTQLAFVLIVAAVALLGGFALRRAMASES